MHLYSHAKRAWDKCNNWLKLEGLSTFKGSDQPLIDKAAIIMVTHISTGETYLNKWGMETAQVSNFDNCTHKSGNKRGNQRTNIDHGPNKWIWVSARTKEQTFIRARINSATEHCNDEHIEQCNRATVQQWNRTTDQTVIQQTKQWCNRTNSDRTCSARILPQLYDGNKSWLLATIVNISNSPWPRGWSGAVTSSSRKT